MTRLSAPRPAETRTRIQSMAVPDVTKSSHEEEEEEEEEEK
ncbi:hypothetical protein E2C01_081370 [Portunus trituberculatus]|uniref:Uncharacterized protein n=1 Tax=Portunus trituberculatus TaxID=210409 RepID=A0A5B7IWG6_PORTR|nr:hypothetical protein [Portunus trituberculatus]